MSRFDYVRDPLEIERQSFERIRALTDLERFDADERQVVMRLVHTCGEPDIVNDFFRSPGATAAGIAAIQRGTTVLCDVEMVRHGLSRRHLSGPVHCFLNTPGVREQAEERGITRSMAALDHWPQHLDGSIVVIGNAPTALFRLLEMLADGASKPALIVAMPVGFVGAEESKQYLIEWIHGQEEIACVTLRGRRGGSALAAAAVNALARLSRGIRL